MPKENLGGFGGQGHPTCGQPRWFGPANAYAATPAAPAQSLCRRTPATSRRLFGLAGLCQFRTHDREKPAFFGSLTLREFV